MLLQDYQMVLLLDMLTTGLATSCRTSCGGHGTGFPSTSVSYAFHHRTSKTGSIVGLPQCDSAFGHKRNNQFGPGTTKFSQCHMIKSVAMWCHLIFIVDTKCDGPPPSAPLWVLLASFLYSHPLTSPHFFASHTVPLYLSSPFLNFLSILSFIPLVPSLEIWQCERSFGNFVLKYWETLI